MARPSRHHPIRSQPLISPHRLSTDQPQLLPNQDGTPFAPPPHSQPAAHLTAPSLNRPATTTAESRWHALRATTRFAPLPHLRRAWPSLPQHVGSGCRQPPLRNQDGTPLAKAALASRAPSLGRPPGWCRAQAHAAAPRPSACGSADPRRLPSGSRDAALGRWDPLASLGDSVHNATTSALPRERTEVSGRSVLRTDEPPSSDRRGRFPSGPRSRSAGTRDPVRAGREPNCPADGPGMERALPREGADDASRGAPRSRLRAAEFSKAPAGSARRGPAQLGPLVRRMEWIDGTPAEPGPDRSAEHMACDRRLASRRWTARLARASFVMPPFGVMTSAAWRRRRPDGRGRPS
jgi:hypothetical protein